MSSKNSWSITTTNDRTLGLVTCSDLTDEQKRSFRAMTTLGTPPRKRFYSLTLAIRSLEIQSLSAFCHRFRPTLPDSISAHAAPSPPQRFRTTNAPLAQNSPNLSAPKRQSSIFRER